MNFLFEPPQTPALPISGTDQYFPIHRIYCVGRNYAEHAREMGHDPDREPPFFFQKNPDTIVPHGGNFPYPDKSENVHFEMELVVAIGKDGKDIAEAEALDHVYGYAAGLDMTRRDLQGAAKKMGRPWEVGKAFEHSAPCGELVPATRSGHISNGRIWLEVNGDIKQDSDIDQLIWNIPETISYLSGLFELKQGDLIYTGTPAGVGPVSKGDQLNGEIEGVGVISVKVI